MQNDLFEKEVAMIEFGYIRGIAIAAVVLAGCSSGESGGGTGAEKAQTPASTSKPAPTQTASSTDPTTPPATKAAACAVAGDKGNNLGVGEYCAKGAGTCPSSLFCTADFAAAEGEEFCTAFCATDADCGQAATCYPDARGSACVPSKCLSK
jgi:hypothetical protein